MCENNDAWVRLKHGNMFPYDDLSHWDDRGEYVEVPPGPSVDWAHYAARGVIADLTDRRGIKHGFGDVDADVRQKIVASLAAIIRAAPKAFHGAVWKDSKPEEHMDAYMEGLDTGIRHMKEEYARRVIDSTDDIDLAQVRKARAEAWLAEMAVCKALTEAADADEKVATGALAS
ncbi:MULTISPECIES: hypothetical protein [Rhizobium/Agrobacterium group]|uniref:Uncharacterized protein n=1 Tax=Agrobacterium genomosp. 2 str. CFBP 5494 TaxID=1183436 RepID=A0A9W5F2Y4_9HYPH|nr:MULTISPECIES: hypothetical protein [Rhizobium/Agrobacterium group]CAD7036364.1 hypothetical protein RP007_04446 [Rhizobium sp. P007]CUW88541.1 hypothetical protein AGR2A_Cc140093 [Agrobacterium genomosp. 2 str. CFBP 5494]